MSYPFQIWHAAQGDRGVLIPKLCNKFSSTSKLNAVRYKPTKCCKQQVNSPNSVKHWDEISKTEEREDFIVSHERLEYTDKVINMVTQYKRMWDGHLESIEGVQHIMDVDKNDHRPNYTVSYHTATQVKEFKKQEMNGML